MIFLTVGTQLPFDRLVETMDVWSTAHSSEIALFGQIADPGVKGYFPKNFEWKSFVEPQEFKERFENAELIISHAGMGSIITALTLGKPIIILPRLASLGEHRNEHQLATAEKFQSRAGVHVVKDEKKLAKTVDQILQDPANTSRGNANPFASEQLINSLRDFILK